MKFKILLFVLSIAFLRENVAFGDVKCPDPTDWKGEEVMGDWEIYTGKNIAAEQRAEYEKSKEYLYTLKPYHAWLILKHKDPTHAPMDCVFTVAKEGVKTDKKVTFIYKDREAAADLHFDEANKAYVKCSNRGTVGWKCTAKEDDKVFPDACTYIKGNAAPCPPVK